MPIVLPLLKNSRKYGYELILMHHLSHNSIIKYIGGSIAQRGDICCISQMAKLHNCTMNSSEKSGIGYLMGLF